MRFKASQQKLSAAIPFYSAVFLFFHQEKIYLYKAELLNSSMTCIWVETWVPISFWLKTNRIWTRTFTLVQTWGSYLEFASKLAYKFKYNEILPKKFFLPLSPSSAYILKPFKGRIWHLQSTLIYWLNELIARYHVCPTVFKNIYNVKNLKAWQYILLSTTDLKI